MTLPPNNFQDNSIGEPHTLAHPLGPAVGSVNGTVSPGVDRETADCEVESQRNSSFQRFSLSLSGSRMQSCLSISKLVPSTPTAKKENALSLSPCLTCSAAERHSSVA